MWIWFAVNTVDVFVMKTTHYVENSLEKVKIVSLAILPIIFKFVVFSFLFIIKPSFIRKRINCLLFFMNFDEKYRPQHDSSISIVAKNGILKNCWSRTSCFTLTVFLVQNYDIRSQDSLPGCSFESFWRKKSISA